jgi:enterochelin esterase-like enzyme
MCGSIARAVSADFAEASVVRAVDARYRTIASGSARALAGLSEGGYAALNIGIQGGYAALNIGIHHPGEFHVLESWSGYQRADNIAAIFGHHAALLQHNSPSLTVPSAAQSLRRAGTYIWFYSGTDDTFRKQNAAFARELVHLGLPHRFFLVRGGHNWALWRGNAARALLALSLRLHAA